ncbi:MAG: hypothetical protein JXC32_02715 [Anaerolineae bacterium]|nr:hypothetical protein [Anaerolineae bacterium]
MDLGLATWPWVWEDDEALVVLLADAKGWGCTMVSFHPQQLLDMTEAGRRSVADQVEALDLGVTIHGNCRQTPETIVSTAALFGRRLRAYTFDAAMVPEPRGYVYDAKRAAQVLAWALEATEAVSAFVGMEDLPLDAVAVEAFATALAPVLVAPRVGILIDIGHMHLRRTQGPCFGGRSIDAYFARVPLPIVECHVHDNDGYQDAHRHLGEGTLPVDAVAAAVAAHAPGAICTIEVAPALHAGDIAAERPRLPATLLRWQQAIADARGL